MDRAGGRRQIGSLRQLAPRPARGKSGNLIEAGGDDRQILERRRARLVNERRRLKLMKIQGEFDDNPGLYEEEQARIHRQLAELPAPANLEAFEQAAGLLEEMAEIWDVADLADRRDLLRITVREVRVDVPQGRVATIEPYPVFVPLFRQIPLVHEVPFGGFAPRWVPEQSESPEGAIQIPPLLKTRRRDECPDWPLICTLPEEIVGQRITPALSDWLKKRREAGHKTPPGCVVDLARPGVPPLEVDTRWWPGVAIKRVEDLQSLKDADTQFLWTPFALQRAEDRAAFIEQARRVVEPGGRWAFVDVMPTSMPDHWLYRFFPGVWDTETKSTWNTSQMYNALRGDESYRVQLKRRTVYQAITLQVARRTAQKREACPQLKHLSDEAYEAGLQALEEAVRQKGAKHLVGAAYCLMEVSVTHATGKPVE